MLGQDRNFAHPNRSGSAVSNPEQDKQYIPIPAAAWPARSQMKQWYKTGQSWVSFPIREVSPFARKICDAIDDASRREMLSVLPMSMKSVPAGFTGKKGDTWNLLEFGILRWDISVLTEILSHLDLQSSEIRLEMGKSLTRAHQFLNRGKASGHPYMPVESMFSARLLSLVAAGAHVDQSYWGGDAPAQRTVPRGVFATGERHIGVVTASVHALPDDLAARAIRNLASQGYDIDAMTENSPSTALHLACRRGMTATIEALLALGADPDKTTNNGWNADSFAKAGKQSHALKMLDAYRAHRVIQRALDRVKAVP
jgi:hypothetical protein